MKYKLQDLIDIEHFQNLQDRLNDIYSFPSSIIDNDGNILTSTAWQDICTHFHRKNKECEKLCIESDQYIKDHIHEANPAVSYRCPHGLVDNATPIIIEGIHYGNFFTGQFFLEKPDLEFFRTQAQKYGFNEDTYLKAVKSVPVWTRKQLDNYLFFIKGLIAVISESGLKTLKEIENRKQMEATEKRYKSILKTAMDGYWLTDTEGRLIEVNDSYCRMSGYSEDDLLAMNISDLVAAENFELVAEHMQKIISQGSDRFESRHRRKDGTFLDVEVSTQFCPEEGGQCVCFLRDITKQKLAEKALRESEERFKALHDASFGGIIIHEKGVILACNQGLTDMTGFSNEELVGMNGFNLIHPDSLDRVMQNVNSGHGQRYEVEGLRKDGSLYSLAIRGKNIHYKGGEARVIEFRDITKRKMVEKALQKSEQRFRELTNLLPQTVFEVDVHGNLTYSNQMGLEATGYSLEDIHRGLNVKQTIVPNDRNKLLTNFSRIIEERINSNNEYTLLRKDGTTFPGIIYSSPIIQNDKVVGVRGIVADISDRKIAEKEKEKLEARLQQSQKMESIGNLAGGIAHDFNNILSSVIGFTELALGEVQKGTPIEDDLQEVYAAGLRAKEMVNQILAFARHSDEKLTPIQVDFIIKEVLKFIRSSIPASIEIKQNIEGDSLIMGNSTQIHQMMMNLCTNAAHAMEDEGGTLEITMKEITVDTSIIRSKRDLKPGSYIEIKVSDTGYGIEPQIIDKIFEPYFTTKGPGEGTGMGLAMVHGIVESYNGKIGVDSGLGKGTIFTIHLPVARENKDHRLSRAEELPAGKERILFVDDEAQITKMAARIIGQLGYSVTTKTNSLEALELFRSNPNDFDLVISDVTMPKMTGDELAKRLRQIRPDIPVILCTGYSERLSEEKASEIGIKAFAYKPIIKEDLAKTVRYVLDELKSNS